MAYIGLVKPTVANLDESGAAPRYTNGFKCGEGISLDISPQYAEGSLYAGNKKVEYDKEFKYADVTLNTDTLPIAAHNVMFGHEVENEGESGTRIRNRTTDASNYVGFGICVNEQVNGVKKYVAMWIYKVKFTEGQESFKTKGDNIEYQTPTIAGQAIGISDNLWKDTQVFDTEEDAYAWIDKMAGIQTETEPGGDENTGSEGTESGGGENTGSEGTEPGGDENTDGEESV